MISLYLSQSSWIHRLPAGLKLMLLVLSSIVLYPIEHPLWHSLFLLIVMGLYASLGREALASLRILRPLVMFFSLIFILQAWTVGWMSAMTLMLRMITLILLANLVSLTTTMSAMMDTIVPLLKPLEWLNIQPKRIAFAVTLMIRFVPLLMVLAEQLMSAWRSRQGGKKRWKLVIPMTLNAIKLADQIAEALAARGGLSPVNEKQGYRTHEPPYS